MGQRHQLFVIACINGKYRCLAAVHHQWLYGHLAARQCLETLKIFNSSLNRVALQEELKLASSYNAEFWEPRSQSDYIPRFPFIMTCLYIGAGFEQSRGYAHRVSIETWQMKYDEGDNNEGITIFDITEASNPRYCFVNFGGIESVHEVQRMSPLDAGTYLRAYEDAHEFANYTEIWSKWQLISVATLRDTWPRGAWPRGDWQEPLQDQIINRRSDEDSDDSILDNLEIDGHSLQVQSHDLHGEMRNFSFGSPEALPSENAVTGSLSEGEPERIGPLSLQSQALTSLAGALVRDRELDEDALSRAQMLPDFWPAVRVALYKNADSLKSTPKTRELMYQSLKEEQDVDAGPFTTITIPDLAIVLDRLSNCGQMKRLNLSGRPTLTKNELEVLIKHTKALQALYLMGAPGSLSINDLTGLALPGDIYHHVLLEQAIRPRTRAKGEGGPNMPQFMPGEHPVRHIAYVSISAIEPNTGKLLLTASGLDWDNLIVDRNRPSGSHLYRPVGDGMKCRKYPLVDTPMPLPRLVIGIRNLFEWLSKGVFFETSDLSYGLASSFALGSSAQGSDPVNVGLGPLSNELKNCTHECAALRLAPGEWSLIIIHPGPGGIPRVIDFQMVGAGYDNSHVNKVYYAFVKCNGAYDDLSVHDLHGYLKEVGVEEAEQLRALSEGWPGFHFYDRSDIGVALQKIYQPDPDQGELK